VRFLFQKGKLLQINSNKLSFIINTKSPTKYHIFDSPSLSKLKIRLTSKDFKSSSEGAEVSSCITTRLTPGHFKKKILILLFMFYSIA
jgi:hypothetical protein